MPLLKSTRLRSLLFSLAIIFCVASTAVFAQAQEPFDIVPAANAQRGELTAIVDATIVDGSGAEPFQGSVLIRGDRIEAVGPALHIPGTAHVILAEGKTLLPGLFDLHTHLSYAGVRGRSGDWGKNLKAYLYSGVTSVADFGAYPETFAPMRRLLHDGVVEGPRIHLAARLATPAGHGMEGGRGDYFSFEISTPRQARATVRRLLAYKPDAIKVFTDGWRYGNAPEMTSMNEETLAAIVDESHRAGMEVLTHTVTLERAKIAARAGVDVIAHGVGDRAVDHELVELLKRHGTTYVPTLAVYHPRGRDLLTQSLSGVLDPFVRDVVNPPLTAPSADTLLVRPYELSGDGQPSARARRWGHLSRNNRTLHSGGVTFGAGTDAGLTNTFHGWSTLRELQLLVHAGLSPLEAITAATGNSARALNVESERGTIAAGKLADLVLVDGAPHRDIADILKIERVFLGGRELDRARLSRDIRSADPTPIPARRLGPLLDDMETPGRESSIGTRWVNRTDRGADSSRSLLNRTLRGPSDHALTIHARMSQEDDAFVSADLPLSPGGIEPVDVSGYRGVRFDARGEGEYGFRIVTRRVRNYDYHQAVFEAGAEWSRVAIDFLSLSQPSGETPVKWTGKDVTMLLFEVHRPAGEGAWLELDNIELYK